MRASLAAVLLVTGLLQAAPQQPAAAPKAEYVGSEGCAACHSEVAEAFQKTRHQALEKDAKRGWQGRGCESCHGPGSKHAESTEIADILNPAKLAPAEENNACLKCHVNQTARVGRIESGHAGGQVACSSCHTVHAKPGRVLLERRKPQINAQCSQCHQSSWAAFQRPHAHPVSQGAMSCTDCHNPHNPVGWAAKREAFGNEPACAGCHTNLRGPFVFEHAPVRLEGCSSCHVPHGSANPKMLTRHEVRTVCLECHSDLGAVSGRASNTIGSAPPAFHDIRSPRFQSCTACHRKVHGSHVDRSLQR